MIDYLVANGINHLLTATHLIWANSLKFIQGNPLLLKSANAGLGDQVGWTATRTHFATEISLPFFYPNCYPFHNAGGSILSMVRLVPVCQQLH
ncbi:MAG: hypothetical protein BGO59_30340 [Spirosoma sp. 48-14]|nr:MAG: hypothetical protein BGO59_30340 [Spirosoma sp. 48-14]